MDVIASVVLLAAFILFVDATFGEGNHVAAQLGGLFSSGAALGWPSGVQEEDHPWLVALRAPAGPGAGTAWATRQLRSLPSAADRTAWPRDQVVVRARREPPQSTIEEAPSRADLLSFGALPGRVAAVPVPRVRLGSIR